MVVEAGPRKLDARIGLADVALFQIHGGLDAGGLLVVEGGQAVVDVPEIGAGGSGTQPRPSIMMLLLKSSVNKYFEVPTKRRLSLPCWNR